MKNIARFRGTQFFASICILFLMASCSQSKSGPEQTGLKVTVIKAVKGDSFTSLSKKHLKDSSKDWMIREFNQNKKRFPLLDQTLLLPMQPFALGGIRSSGYQTIPVLRYVSMDPKTFEEQLKILKKRGYRTLSMDQFFAFLQFKAQVPSKAVLIAIDDNSPIIYNKIFPLLKKYKSQAVLFVDPLGVGQKKSLAWKEIKTMSTKGMSIQCKLSDNRDWTSLKPTETFAKYFKSLEKEFKEPRKILQKEFGKNCDFVAYPQGKSSHLIVGLIKQLGYRGGFSLHEKANPFFVDPYEIGSFSIDRAYKKSEFIGVLDHFKTFGKKAKQDLGLPLAEENQNIPLHYQSLGEKLRKSKDYPRSLWSWSVVAELDSNNSKLTGKIEELNQLIKQQAETHYKKARKSHKKKKLDQAKNEYLKVLYHDPLNKKSLYFLTERMREREYIAYTIKKKETLKTIANKVYGDKDKDLLIRYFNKAEVIKKMKPGELLILPRLSGELTKKSDDLILKLAQAESLIAEKKLEEALALSEEILILEPKNTQAGNLKNLIYKTIGEQLRAGKKPLLSLKAYQKIDIDSPEIKMIIKELIQQISELSETYYKKGIEFFINEDLKSAILSWKETLRLNSSHPKAAKDLKNAEDLQEKLKNL